ncbi:MAG TPA: calcium-binding protein [Thermoanaerobaculia bacterium]|nr:calcium-binding protein [Thermoanaerobaculia bacterium]
MNRKCIGLTVAIAAGVLSLMATAPASALDCVWQCTCESSCDDICITGPFIQDCPECNQIPCGDYGTCMGSAACPTGTTCSNAGFTSTINGTSGGDNLNGTSANERINGFGGNDTLYGHAGDDRLYGDAGADTLYGGSGDDCLFGGDGNDHLAGETGTADWADGGFGTDTCTAETETSCEI